MTVAGEETALEAVRMVPEAEMVVVGEGLVRGETAAAVPAAPGWVLEQG